MGKSCGRLLPHGSRRGSPGLIVSEAVGFDLGVAPGDLPRAPQEKESFMHSDSDDGFVERLKV